MTRRQALLAVLAVLVTRDGVHGRGMEPGWLTVNLSQWPGVIVRLDGQEPYYVDSKELFDALRET